MDHKTVITNAWYQSLKANFNETFHPIRAQVVPGSVITYGSDVVSTTKDEDVVILSFDTFDYFPRLRGKLSHVYFELSFQIKANDSSASIIYQLQARDRGHNSWIDLSAAVPVSTIGTSYVTYLFKGYMDIKNHISQIPFEMRIIAQSDESSDPVLISFTCTWSDQAPGGSGTCRAVLQFGDNLYGSFNDTIYYQDGDDSWVACTGTMGQVRNFAVSEVIGGSDRIFAVTNTTMRVKGASDQVWANISGSPDGAWSLVQSSIVLAGTEILYIGCNNGEIQKTTDGVAFSTCGSAGSSAIRALVEFDGKLYAGSADGDVYVWDKGTGWAKVGTGTMSLSEVYCLCVHSIATNGENKLYAGGLGADVYVLNDLENAWASTGGLAGNASRVFALVSFLQDGEPLAVLFAATGNAADVDYWDGVTTWTNTGELSGDYQVLCLGVYTENDTIYAGSNNWGKIWKASISPTWKSGELTGRVKNDIAGQETFIQAVGSVGGIGIPANE